MRELLGFVAIIVFMFAVLISLAILASYYEAKAYNKLTGANVSTSDAFWLELRISDEISYLED